MAQNENTAKQPKRRSAAGIIFLILLLLLAGAGGYLYYSVVKVPFEPDDFRKMAAAEPMSAEERFRFSSDGTAQIRMDAADIWSVILENAGTDFLDVLNKELSGLSLSVSGCHIHLDQEGLRLDLELRYRDTRLVARVPCDLEFSGRHISLAPTGVKLGVIPLPVERLLSSVKLEYDLTLPVIPEVTRLDFVTDALLLTGPVEQDIRTLVPLDDKLYRGAVFLESLQPLTEALTAEAGFARLLEHLEKDPGSVEDLYRQLFVMADDRVCAAYLEERQDLTRRFFPGIDFAAVTEEQEALSNELSAWGNSLDQFFTEVVGDYNDKNFRLSGGEFLKKRKPFHPSLYGEGKYDALFEILDPDAVFLILVDAQNGFIRKTSSFYRMADEKQEFTQPVDFDKTYIIGCVLRSVDSDPYLLYEEEIAEANSYFRHIVIHPLTEEEVLQLQVPGKFGVWSD